ncbi:general stress protein [Bacillus daqingensis]|uniref:General stress protein n=1 Tax=Bacillus daqingensis TaxID=872396 RepID=A0ABV9NP87_9BACI
MKKRVVGVFSSESEVRESVESLKLDGHRPEEIIVAAGDSDAADWLKSETNVRIEEPQQEEGTGNEEDQSFWEKIKTAFKGTTEFKGQDGGSEGFTFDKIGITGEEGQKLEAELDNGRMVVLAPEMEAGAAFDDEKTEGSIDPEGPSQIGDPMSSEDPAEQAEDAPKFPQDSDVDEKHRDR